MNSLADVCTDFPDLLEGVDFNTNGIKDEALANLIESFGHQTRFNSLIIRHNEFGPKSVEKISVLTNRGFGDCLDELRIISCHTSSEVISQLLDNLEENRNLQKLGLV